MRDWIIQLYRDLTVDTVLFPVEFVVVIYCVLCLQIPALRQRLPGVWPRGLRLSAPVSMITTLVVALLGHAIMEPGYTIPAPGVHDEFSYLLAGETFAAGRITNPPHPMRYFFESFHTLQEPTYMSMYPPGQGLALALGILVGGHPIWGVWLSAAALAAGVCWMLLGLTNPAWALVGGLLCAIRISWFSYWANSYWGGAVPAIGGVLLVGAALRISRKPTWQSGMILGAGVLILANTRMWEGAIAASTVGVWLAIRLYRRGARPSLSVIAAVAAILVPGCIGMLYYNYSITGRPTRLPYLENRGRYEVYGSFVWDTEHRDRHFDHLALERFYKDAEGYRAQLGYWWIQAEKPERLWFFFVGPALTPLLLGLLGGTSAPSVFLATSMVLTLALGQLLVPWHIQAHYAAPITGAAYVLIVVSMRRLLAKNRRGGSWGRPLVYGSLLACVVMAGFRTLAPTIGVKVYQERTNPWYSYGLKANFNRQRVEEKLLRIPGKHLVLVQYGKDHHPDLEWVYNHADIDGSAVVWARYVDDESRLSQLLAYYEDRRVWMINPDADPKSVVDYSEKRKGENK